MLAELIRAEWDRRRAVLGLLLALYLVAPGSYMAVLAGRREFAQVMTLAPLLMVTVVGAATAWGGGSWASERRGRWTYFLSLPVGRLRHFALRYAAGLAWLALPVAALAAGAYAASALPLPRGMYAYPGPFAAWVALVSWLAYTAGFVAAARWEHPGRAAGLALLAFVLLVILTESGAAPFLDPLRHAVTGSALAPLRLVLDMPPLLGT